MVTNGQRCGATAIMENQALLMVVERILDAGDELVAKEAITGEIGAILEVDDVNASGFIGLNGEFTKLNDGVVLFAKIIVGN